MDTPTATPTPSPALVAAQAMLEAARAAQLAGNTAWSATYRGDYTPAAQAVAEAHHALEAATTACRAAVRALTPPPPTFAEQLASGAVTYVASGYMCGNVLVGYRHSSGPTGREACTGFVPDTTENRALVAAAGLTICQANWSR
jgi:hypothetical protein